VSARFPYAAPLVLALLGGCDDTFISVSSDGNIQVAVTTSGSDLDTDGFRIIVDGNLDQPVSTGGTVTLAGLTPGDHSVRLTGLANNCRVEGDNPRTVSVEADGTAAVSFDVRCSRSTQGASTQGSFTIIVTTFGQPVDADGYKIAVAGVGIRRVPVNVTETFTGVPPGRHLVSLKDVVNGCSVTTANPLLVTGLSGQDVQASFNVECGIVPQDPLAP
jgi:hypothetical protein